MRKIRYQRDGKTGRPIAGNVIKAQNGSTLIRREMRRGGRIGALADGTGIREIRTVFGWRPSGIARPSEGRRFSSPVQEHGASLPRRRIASPPGSGNGLPEGFHSDRSSPEGYRCLSTGNPRPSRHGSQ